MTDAHDLPSYAKPPVNEVVLSVAFDQPPGLTVAHLGDFWHRCLKDGLPEIEEQPPYHRPFEILGPPSPRPMNVQFLDRPPSPRLWAKNSDGTKLLQLQSDWFAFNWRDASPPQLAYPRWPSMEGTFLDHLHKFEEYLAAEDLGRVLPRQCEVTYINQIRGSGVWTNHGELHRVVTPLSQLGGFLPEPETSQLSMSFRLRDADDVERGRMHVTVQPVFNVADNEPIVVLTLVARGEPVAPDEPGVLQFMRLGHEWIVRGFTDLTTPEMHQAWERLT
jgi:uncharacterized protein (TIGR04255 family)